MDPHSSPLASETLVRLVHPEPGVAFDARSEDGRTMLLDLYSPPAEDWLRLNLVTSVSGSAAGPDGTSESLTSSVDRQILGVIRQLADVVLVGATSVRAEGYQLPRRTRLAVLTASGDLRGHRLGDDLSRLLLLGPAAVRDHLSPELSRVEFLPVDTSDAAGRLDMPVVVDALRAEGFRSIVCEGGPALATQLLAAGCVDELCLTTAPLATGTDLPLFGGHAFAATPLSLDQLMVGADGGLFARWGVKARGATD